MGVEQQEAVAAVFFSTIRSDHGQLSGFDWFLSFYSRGLRDVDF